MKKNVRRLLALMLAVLLSCPMRVLPVYAEGGGAGEQETLELAEAESFPAADAVEKEADAECVSETEAAVEEIALKETALKETVVEEDAAPLANSFTLTFDANGGTNAPAKVTGNGQVTIPGTVPVRTGCSFRGWSSQKKGILNETDPWAVPGEQIDLNQNRTLYAVWEAAKQIEVPTRSSQVMVSIDVPNAGRIFSFVPAAAENTFRFSTQTGDADPIITIYDSNGKKLAEADDISLSDYNFSLTYSDFARGATYYLEVGLGSMGNRLASYQMKVERGIQVAYSAPDVNQNDVPEDVFIPAGNTYTCPLLHPHDYKRKFRSWKEDENDSQSYVPGAEYYLEHNLTLHPKWESPRNFDFLRTKSFVEDPVSQKEEDFTYRIRTTISTRYLIQAFVKEEECEVYGELYTLDGKLLMAGHCNEINQGSRMEVDLEGGQEYYLLYRTKGHYGLTFQANATPGIKVTFDDRDGTGQVVTAYLYNDETFTKYNPQMPSSTFEGWYTSPRDGQRLSGQNDIRKYADGYIPEITLYARWKTSFVDVPKGTYYYEPVLWAAAQRITGGKDATHFAPDEACTRGQVVTFLWRANGCPEPTGKTNPFTDVSASAYYYKAVLWAYEQGITSGTDATHFAPETKVTRAQFVTFLWRSEGKPAVSMANPFVDVPQNIFTQAILWAYSKGITLGRDSTHFTPNETCTRAQVVTFLYRNANS